MPARVNLDLASAAPWHERSLVAHRQVAEAFPGDPARLHREGRDASDLLERARGAVAEELGARPDGVVFTGSGTEAIHLAVLGTVRANARRPRRILSAAVEHSAVLAAADRAARHEGWVHERVPVDGDGRVDVDALTTLLADGAALVNVQHANHEVGTIQPVEEVAAACRAADALLHVDAAQTAGRLPVSLERLGADYLSVSAAKFGGGRGVGALLTSPGARLEGVVEGDERERRRRAGLQDLPGIAAMAETLATLRPRNPVGEAGAEVTRAHQVRRALRVGLAALPDVAVHGPAEGTLPHVVAASALYVEGQALVTALDRAGYAVHSGSSCATTSGEPSHVLLAMGALTHGHVRMSFGPGFTEADVGPLCDTLAGVLETERARLGA